MTISTMTGLPRPAPSLVTGGTRVPVGGTNPVLVLGRYLVFVRDSTVVGAPIDIATLTLTAAPRELLAGVRREVSSGQAQWGLTAAGTLVWASGADRGLARLAFVNRNGAVTDTVFTAPSLVGSVGLSLDGKRIALERLEEGGGSRLAIVDLERQVEDAVPASGPLKAFHWLASGRGLLVGVGSSFGRTVASALVGTDGRLEPTDTTFLDESPDGQQRCGSRPGLMLWHVRAPAERITLDRPAFECFFSPDGRWLVWWNWDGIFLAPTTARGPDARIRIAGAGLTESRWTSDSREIIAHAQDSHLSGHDQYAIGAEPRSWYAIRVPARPGERAEAPRLLFKNRVLDADGPSYDVAPDGRLLVILGSPPTPITHLEVMTNFPAFVAGKLKAAAP